MKLSNNSVFYYKNWFFWNLLYNLRVLIRYEVWSCVMNASRINEHLL